MFLISQNLNETCILYVVVQVLTTITSIIDWKLNTIWQPPYHSSPVSLFKCTIQFMVGINMLKRKPIVKHNRPNH